jgi:putative PIN family toxin of toxin-antitoxin system
MSGSPQWSSRTVAVFRCAVERAILVDTIATCAEIEAETIRVLTEKFGWAEDRVSEALTGYLSKAIRVLPRGLVMGCRDPKDDIVLECAVLANADAIIAGDKDLLVMEELRGTRIITPAMYLLPV